MSTNASIGILNDNGKVVSIQVKFDGYPGTVGERLSKHYRSKEKVNKLVNLGWIVSLGDNLEPPLIAKRYGCDWVRSDEFNALDEHEQESLKREYFKMEGTVARIRDCKSRDTRYKTKEWNSIGEWIKGEFCSYNYVFYKGKWYAFDILGISIDTTTGSVVKTHNLPGVKKGRTSRKPKLKYTKEMADKDMRMIKKEMKGRPYGTMSVTILIKDNKIDKKINTNSPFRVTKAFIGEDYVCLEIGYNKLYQWDYNKSRTVPVKEETMGNIREMLYELVNKQIAYVNSVM